MKLYLVRHGESTSNAGGLHQDHTPDLSALGKKQAHLVAERFNNIPIDIIISSPYSRAQQTAEIIHKKIQKEIIFTELIQELKRPTELEGLPYDNSESKKIKNELMIHKNDPDWHYSDEENFFDLQTRATRFLEYVNVRKEKSILAVSHGLFIKFVVCTMIFGDLFTVDMYNAINHRMKSKNTGITFCELAQDEKWNLLAWNNYSHLE